MDICTAKNAAKAIPQKVVILSRVTLRQVTCSSHLCDTTVQCKKWNVMHTRNWLLKMLS